MRRHSRASLLTASLGLAALAMLLAAALFWHHSSGAMAAARDIEHGHAGLAAVRQLALEFMRAEAAALRYLDHGHETDLLEHGAALASATATMQNTLAASLQDDGPHRRTLQLLGELRISHGDLAHAGIMAEVLADLADTETARLATLGHSLEAREGWRRLSFAVVLGMLAACLCALQASDRLLQAERKQRRDIEEACAAAQGRLRGLCAAHETIRDQERKRVARILHDGLGQDLYVLKIAMGRLQERARKLRSRLHGEVAEPIAQVDALMKAMRLVISDVRPEVLNLGLAPALRWQCSKLQANAGIPCSFICDAEPVSLPDETCTGLFYILQEALTNVLRHAAARSVTVVLCVARDRMTLSISDDGCGFEMASGRSAQSSGLHGIRERALGLGGSMELDSAVGRGTVIRVGIPLP